jgi:predicted CxxxxCH...CXXCH cytochrome family protein
MRIDRIATLAVTSALLLAGCNKERQVAGETGGCLGCHGGQSNLTGLAAAAPPFDTHGDSSSPLVGAHTLHLSAGVSCDTCHVVPANTDSAGHIDQLNNGRAEVTFGTAASVNGATPAYDYAARTCSNTYCHAPKTEAGVSLEGSTPAPKWDGAALRCVDCHAYPPLAVAPHGVATTDCSSCHSETVDADDVTILAGGKHMNGRPDATGGGCTGCHGDATRAVSGHNQPAPPKDTQGNTSSQQIGAHQIHLEGRGSGGATKPLAKGFRCEECHVYPTTLAHVDDRPAELSFQGPTGTAAGRTPAYESGAMTCASTYCHNPARPDGQVVDLGGTNHVPSWNGGASEVAGCTACHGKPPPAPHPQVDKASAPITATTQCNQCHPGTVGTDGNILIDPSPTATPLHVNGEINTDYHPADFASSAMHGPAANYHSLTLFPQGIETCKTCHGADLNGGIVGAAGSCNGCHTANGKPDWATAAGGCNFCHGSTTGRASLVATAMPPVDTLGHNANTDRGTGAHLTHLNGRATGAVSDGVACTSCHTSPDYTDIAHVNGTVELKAELGFQSAPGTCANACHGDGLQGGTHTTPAWTETSLACTACHGNPPATGRDMSGSPAHVKHINAGYGCTNCHHEVASSNTTIDPATGLSLHVNGSVNVKFWRSNNAYPTQVWTTADGSCANVCHGTSVRTWR